MSKSPREVLEKIYRDGLDGEKSPEEYDINQALHTLAEIVRGEKLQCFNDERGCGECSGCLTNRHIDHIAKLFEKENDND